MLLHENGIYVLGSIHISTYPSRKLEKFLSNFKGQVWCEADGKELDVPYVDEIYDYRCTSLASSINFLESTEEHLEVVRKIFDIKAIFGVQDILYRIAYWFNSDYNGLVRARNRCPKNFQEILMHRREQKWLEKVNTGDLLVVGALHIPGLVSENAKMIMKTLECIRSPTKRELKQEKEKHDDKKSRPVLGTTITQEAENDS